MPAKAATAVFNLHIRAMDIGDYLDSVGEFNPWDLEEDGPTKLAELVLAIDETFSVVCDEARLQVPRKDREEWASHIRAWLSDQTKKKATQGSVDMT
jgi:hypothetical protein